MFGLSEDDINIICKTFSAYTEIDKAYIFGSRAMDNYKSGSDIDIAIQGHGINNDLLVKISSILNEEIPLPYFIDVLNFDQINNEELKKHIRDFGKVFYKK